jgi:hypothetical protein
LAPSRRHHVGAVRLRPRQWDLLKACTKNCTLSEAKLGAEHAKIVHGWYEQGLGDQKIAQNSYELGLTLSMGAIGRHRGKHLRPHTEITETDPTGPKMDDLDALEKILDVGSRQIDNWKVTPSDYFKALDMKYKLTQGSAFQGTLDQLALAEEKMDEEDDE